ncbi:MAG: endonuclease/exonuclease/phosphatase family protein [Chloroflexi bacterium]|nr:endonuclease/exonuclease/phosphatase family protein [Chloroflexota bacterium]
MSLKILTWNVEKVTPKSWKKAPVILDRIDQHKPEVVCLTEAHIDLLQGYVIASQPDFGLGEVGGQRKVVLWSSEPWRDIEETGDDSMPPGRFVRGVTQTSLGEVTVIGVCIPWADALKHAGYQKWRAHEEYLDRLAEVLRYAPTERVVVMGDFNQRMRKGSTAPLHLQSALRDAFPPGMTIATGAVGFRGRRTIDHIALSDDLVVESIDVVSNINVGGTRLSDHFGIAAEVTARSS